MNRALRAVVRFAAGACVLFIVERVGRLRGRGSAARARALLARLRPRPIAEETVEARVRKKLARTALHPDAITVTIEHGCVDLRGPVDTHERAQIVRAVAAVRGVDSVLDLMTEPRPAQGPG